jgi:hypothetical protein
MPLTKVKSLGITDGAVVGADIADSSIALAKLSATGTASASTFLRGDNSWGSAGATAGQVIQVVTATDQTARYIYNQTSFVTGSIGLSLSITPSSASNKVYITTSFSCYGGTFSSTTIFRNSTNLGDSTYGMGYINEDTQLVCMSYLDSPATTSAITYRVYVKTASQVELYYNRNVTGMLNSITAFEIKG